LAAPESETIQVLLPAKFDGDSSVNPFLSDSHNQFLKNSLSTRFMQLAGLAFFPKARPGGIRRLEPDHDRECANGLIGG
jgi:hypothetical protein